jgi:hypothetical protein
MNSDKLFTFRGNDNKIFDVIKQHANSPNWIVFQLLVEESSVINALELHGYFRIPSYEKKFPLYANSNFRMCNPPLFHGIRKTAVVFVCRVVDDKIYIVTNQLKFGYYTTINIHTESVNTPLINNKMSVKTTKSPLSLNIDCTTSVTHPVTKVENGLLKQWRYYVLFVEQADGRAFEIDDYFNNHCYGETDSTANDKIKNLVRLGKHL